jgi:mRNA interferase RelE/StbE
MSLYEVAFTPAATKEINKLPKKVVQRVLDAVADLTADPRPKGCKKIHGEDNVFRIRVGDYRSSMPCSTKK